MFKGLAGIVRLSQRWKGPGSPQASELHKDMSTWGGRGCQDSGSFPICTLIQFFSHLAVIADACQKSHGHTSCIPSQPGDSSQACRVALNKHKIVAGREMLTRDVDANEEEQQSFRQGRKTAQQTTHGLMDENSIYYVKGRFPR